MQPSIKIGRVLGIEIGLHYSWFIIAFLITLSLGANFTETNPDWPGEVVWIAAIATGLLFFGAIVLHELAHAVVAKARGLPVRSITLFALGGLAQIEKEAADPKTEFWMGIAGPIMSVAIGVVSLLLALSLGWSPELSAMTPPMAILVWLGYINFMLAAFNMIPGFPLDGGRVFRAILWWMTGNPDRSTRIAATVGQGVAFVFILFGIWRFFGGAGVGGLWLALIGWFLLDAARASYAQVELTGGLRGVKVRDVMSNDCGAIESHTTLQTFADEYVLRTGRRCFVVKDDGRVAGLLTPHELKNIDRTRWASTTVGQVMRPLSDVRTVTPDTPLGEALQIMGREDVNQLPVISRGRLEGVLSRNHIVQLLESRAELQM
jgi:Zn-dependent protease/predicted transcriptional regulator